MGTNEKKTGTTDEGTTGHSPEFGKISGSAGTTGSPPATRNDEMSTRPSKAGESLGENAGDTGSTFSDPDETDASGSRRSDSISGEIDSGTKSPSRGNSGEGKVS